MKVGTDHPNYVHGKYIEVNMPESLLQKYKQVSQDAEVLSLREDILIVDAFLLEALETITKKEGSDAWARLGKSVKRFKRAEADKDAFAMRESMGEIEGIVLHGQAAYAAKKDFQTWLEQRRKLTDSEVSRRKALGDMVTRAQVLVLIDRVVDLIKTHVPDHTTRVNLSAALLQMIGDSQD